ncbi:lytic polysaccharide monooxygenase [Periconia macrospinosa]|uniref:lytic cellulose monooxygenase (C4-dehydrogenating) n=1 Tax=Periconia macrospinosa TaxID=97972 RepID=A0A2V1DST7_9PLEO|nr:lytic polysaccharide monooxygenase [Periconia macrospinosa]
MCGRNATLPLFPVETLKIEAGSTIGFAAASIKSYYKEHEDFADYDPNFRIYHDGPATAYLSKAHGEPNDYAGDGEWFKIAAIGASDGLNWDVGQKSASGVMNFTIPKSTPPGKYLLRGEHLNINSAYMTTEMYVNCIHVEITGSGQGTPGPTTKFPGAFNAKDDGIWLPNALMRPLEPMDELKNWQGAGPEVWKG